MEQTFTDVNDSGGTYFLDKTLMFIINIALKKQLMLLTKNCCRNLNYWELLTFCAHNKKTAAYKNPKTSNFIEDCKILYAI